jgi:biopolymer transport protein ExbD
MALKLRRNKLLVEVPSVAMGDIAFILIVFFLVCASVQPDSGRHQTIPKSEEKKEKSEQSQNVKVNLTRTGVTINGSPVLGEEFVSRLRDLLVTTRREEDRIVIVKSRKDTPYDHWIHVTGQIETAGGIVTLQLEEERTISVD